MSKTKAKGTRFENMVADTLTKNGVPAERIPLSGSLGGKYGSDVVIGTPENPKATIECKNRESIGKYIWEWIEKHDFLAIKRNHHEPLVVVRLEMFAEMFRLYQESIDHPIEPSLSFDKELVTLDNPDGTTTICVRHTSPKEPVVVKNPPRPIRPGSVILPLEMARKLKEDHPDEYLDDEVPDGQIIH